VSLGIDRNGMPLNTRLAVLTEMFFNICSHYTVLPSLEGMDIEDIEFFYDGMRSILRNRTSKR
jgi:hypothetical protein